jgi:deoxyribodipyrimidine photolyase
MDPSEKLLLGSHASKLYYNIRMKKTVSRVEIYIRFGGIYCFHIQSGRVALKMNRSSETSVNSYQITWRKTPEDSILYIHYPKKVRSHNIKMDFRKTFCEHVK